MHADRHTVPNPSQAWLVFFLGISTGGCGGAVLSPDDFDAGGGTGGADAGSLDGTLTDTSTDDTETFACEDASQTTCGSMCCDNAAEVCVGGECVCKPGTACDGGLLCNAEHECVDGCLIQGSVHAIGATNPSNGCEVCDVSNKTEWTATPGVVCNVNGGNICNVGGRCINPMMISAGFWHTCAVSSHGRATCWGANESGELGCGKTDTPGTELDVKTEATQVSGFESGAVAISAGDAHTCALTSAGGVKCWGLGSDGQIGDGSTGASAIKYSPTQVQGLESGVVAISAGGSHTCALTSTGRVLCWGSNLFGQVGSGEPQGKVPVPQQVVKLNTDIVAISAGA